MIFLKIKKKYWGNLSKFEIISCKKKEVYSSIVRFDMLVMDVYLLSRIFKIFKVYKKSFQPADPHNIIIYSG